MFDILQNMSTVMHAGSAWCLMSLFSTEKWSDLCASSTDNFQSGQKQETTIPAEIITLFYECPWALLFLKYT